MEVLGCMFVCLLVYVCVTDFGDFSQGYRQSIDYWCSPKRTKFQTRVRGGNYGFRVPFLDDFH